MTPEETAMMKEHIIRNHILRHWDREKIKKFALHLLGDKCQSCNEDENNLGDELGAVVDEIIEGRKNAE